MKLQAKLGQSPQAGGPFPRALRLQRQQTAQGPRFAATEMPMPSQTDRALTNTTAHANALARDNTRLRSALQHIVTALELQHGLNGPPEPGDPEPWREPDRTIYALAVRALADPTPHREW